jgi:hypothetical protein
MIDVSRCETMEDCLRAMVEHAIAEPTHGVGCACMDRATQKARRMMDEVLFGAEEPMGLQARDAD